MEALNNTVTAGKFRRSWEITKSSWQILRRDKQIAILPIVGFVISLVVAYLLFLTTLFLTIGSFSAIHHSHNVSIQGPAAGVIFVVLAFIMISAMWAIASRFSGAVAYYVMTRFSGNTPTVWGSLRGTRSQVTSLALFGLVSGSIGFGFAIISQRLPFVGKLAAWLGSTTWTVATMFSIPIIAMSDKPVRPMDAAKRSAKLLKKVWGEGMIVQLGIGLIATLGMVSYIVLVMLISVGLDYAHAPTAVVTPLVVLAVIALFSILLFFNILMNIAKTALYHYATTGEAPEQFSKELLQASLTVKKARRIFA